MSSNFVRSGSFVSLAAAAVRPSGVDVLHLRELAMPCDAKLFRSFQGCGRVFEVVAWNVLVSELGEAWPARPSNAIVSSVGRGYAWMLQESLLQSTMEVPEETIHFRNVQRS